MNTEFLEKFFRNLLLGESNELKNRYCHIKYNEERGLKSVQKINNSPEKVTEKVTETQKKILEILKTNPYITQTELAEIVGISRIHINKNMARLRDMKVIIRIGGDKGGHWEIVK